jgi:hypothetical protein
MIANENSDCCIQIHPNAYSYLTCAFLTAALLYAIPSRNPTYIDRKTTDMAVELPIRIMENIGGFTGRDWLLPNIVKWLDYSNERFFLLSGGPGTGKSMIMAWLAGFGPGPQDPNSLEQLVHVRSAFKAAHFCQASSRNITPRAFAESIANQLTDTV